MARTPQTLININGVTVDASSVKMPASGREFRNAWQLNGDVIEVDMVKAKEITIERVINKAKERVEKAEKDSAKKAMLGVATVSDEAEVTRFRGKPNKAGTNAIKKATTTADLDAITEDTIFS